MEHQPGMPIADPGRRVVLHADDFGMSTAVTDGILQGFAEGLLTSTSLLANAPDAARAIRSWQGLEQARRLGVLPSLTARRHLDDPDRSFDLGVHLNLTQGRPLTGTQYPAALLDGQGRFPGIFVLFRRLAWGGTKFRTAIRAELAHQIQFLLDHGMHPTHLNGHQYVEMIPAVREIVVGLIARFEIRAVRVALEKPAHRVQSAGLSGVPGRLLARVHNAYARKFQNRLTELPVFYPDAYFGVGRAGRVDMHYLRAALARPNRFQLAEIGLHPAKASEAPSSGDVAGGWTDTLSARRAEELRMLLSTELADFFAQEGLRLGRVDPS